MRALDLLHERNGRNSRGDYLEFGVYVGTSLLCMHHAVDSRGLTDVRLFGFDSFQGLPEAADQAADGWVAGQYASDLETTRRHLTANGIDWSRTKLVPGWFDQTLTSQTRDALALERASVIMIDCDTYASTKTALAFCEPLIEETVILFDDWNTRDLAARGLGEKRAFDEFLAAYPEITVREEASYSPNAAVFSLSRPPRPQPADRSRSAPNDASARVAFSLSV